MAPSDLMRWSDQALNANTQNAHCILAFARWWQREENAWLQYRTLAAGTGG